MSDPFPIYLSLDPKRLFLSFLLNRARNSTKVVQIRYSRSNNKVATLWPSTRPQVLRYFRYRELRPGPPNFSRLGTQSCPPVPSQSCSTLLLKAHKHSITLRPTISNPRLSYPKLCISIFSPLRFSLSLAWHSELLHFTPRTPYAATPPFIRPQIQSLYVAAPCAQNARL